MKFFKLHRRTFLKSCAAIAGATVFRASGNSSKATVFSATNLKVEHLTDPLGIVSPSPALSWQVEGEGSIQQSYRVLVATTPEALKRGADLWDSGRVESAACSGIQYEGKPLTSRQRCYWKVILWDQNNEVSPASSAGTWEMGLLNDDDWQGSWLAAESSAEQKSRQVGGTWVTADGTGVEGFPAFRLPFSSSSGMVTVVIQSNGRVIAVTLDGEPLNLFSYVEMLPELKAPVAAVRVPVEAGRHVLGVTTVPGAGVGLAAQIQLPDGEFVIDGWKVKAKPAKGWQLPDSDDANWVSAMPMTPQPWFRMPPGPAQLLRRRFKLKRDTKVARLYVAALGGYDLWVNGQRANDDTLQSEPMDYADHVPYRVYDVTPLLKRGENVVAAMVADGFYASYLLQTGRYSYGPPPRRMLLQLEIIDSAGRQVIISSDQKWKGATGALQASEIYYGEDWDRRLMPDGWLSADFDDSAWEAVLEAPVPEGKLISRIVPPVRVTREMQPKSFTKIGANSFLVDFGQNFAGRVRIKITGSRGSRVIVRHAEILTPEGSIDTKNLRAARATDTYVLSGDANGEILEPRFSFQGFRYAEISGPTDLKPDAVTGLVVHSDLPETGLFGIDQPVIQQLWRNTLWSQRSNFVGWPTDCPQRDERVAWTGDANVFWDTAAFNMDVALFTKAFMTSMRDSQGTSGAFPVWAPNVHPDKFAPVEATPGWSDAGVMLPYIAYQRYADRSVIDENWDAMVRYVEGVLKDNPDGLWINRRGLDLGDWLSLDAKDPGDETTPKDLVATAMIARSAAQLAQMASWTGRDEEAVRWSKERQRIGNAFAEAFVQPDGSVGNRSQTSYILALNENLVPAPLRQKSADLLASDIKRRGTLLSTGFLGTPLALDVLADNGHITLAYDLLERTEYPSWGYMVTRGATTIWERWNGDVGDVTMNSFNHYALGAVSGFLYRRVAGLEPLLPGFARVRIAPLVDARFGHAGCNYQSVRGRFFTDWQMTDDGRVTLNVELPANTTAEIRIPAAASQRITESGIDIAQRTGIKLLGRDAHALTIDAGPGQYRFSVS